MVFDEGFETVLRLAQDRKFLQVAPETGDNFMDKANRHATLLFGILIGFALGNVVGMWSPNISRPFWTDPDCTGPGWYCFAYSWQTLIAGIFALIAARFAWKSVQTQIEAEDRRGTERRRSEFLAARGHFMQLQRWSRNIAKQCDVLNDYEPSSNTPDDDDMIDTLIGNTLFVGLQTTRNQKEMMSVDTLMQLEFVNRQMNFFREKMQQLREECGGVVTLFEVTGETLADLQERSSNISKRLTQLDAALEGDIARIAWQLDELDC